LSCVGTARALCGALLGLPTQSVMYRRVLPVRVISAGLLFGRYIWREALGQ
jgi:hypothetical protein